MATNRTAARAKGNFWPDSDTYQRLVDMVTQLTAIAVALGTGVLAWTRNAGNTILAVSTDLVGIGVVVPLSKLDVGGPIATAHALKTGANEAFTAGDSWIEHDCGANAICGLPQAATCPGRELTYSKVDAGAGTGTLTPFAGDTIEGGGAVVLTTQWDHITIRSDGGTNWKQLACNIGGGPV